MIQKNKLLFPLRIAAFFSVATFGTLGVAAITGHLPVGAGESNRLFAMAASPAKTTELRLPTSGMGPLHPGLTRSGERSGTAQAFTLRKGQKIAASTCEICGVVHSIEPGAGKTATQRLPDLTAGVSPAVHSDQSGAGNYTAANFVITVKMQDGSTRTIHERQRPKFSVGERVRFVNGSIVSLG